MILLLFLFLFKRYSLMLQILYEYRPLVNKTCLVSMLIFPKSLTSMSRLNILIYKWSYSWQKSLIRFWKLNVYTNPVKSIRPFSWGPLHAGQDSTIRSHWRRQGGEEWAEGTISSSSQLEILQLKSDSLELRKFHSCFHGFWGSHS